MDVDILVKICIELSYLDMYRISRSLQNQAVRAGYPRLINQSGGRHRAGPGTDPCGVPGLHADGVFGVLVQT